MNNTLIKGLRLLEVLAARAQPVGISELAQELEMGASNVHRLLQALVAVLPLRLDERSEETLIRQR